MAKIIFPSDIDYDVLRDGYKYEYVPTLAESSSDYPVYKVRRLGTFSPERYTMVLSMTPANRRKLFDFYNNTIGVTKPFQWVVPDNTSETIDVRFANPPEFVKVAVNHENITVVIETVVTAEF